MAFPDLTRRLDAIEDRHLDVHEHDVGGVFASRRHGGGAVADRGHDMKVRVQVEHGAQTFADHGVIVGDHDAKWACHASASGIVAWTVPPPEGPASTEQVPPSSVARACHPRTARLLTPKTLGTPRVIGYGR